jgi:hypothetical protein
MARKTGIHLHARDLALLEQLLVRRAETLDWLHDEHFGGLTRKRARNRLGDLVAHGYLRRTTVPAPTPTGWPQSVYTLGPKAATALRLRALAGEHLRGRRFNPVLRETSIPHQLQINRVGDALGAQLIPEHLLDVRGRDDRHQRPDAAYRAAQPDEHGRELVLVEVDLGHYSRRRMLAKVQGFLEHPDARSILIAVPNRERAALIARWVRDEHGPAVMDRVQTLPFADLHRPGALDPGTEPAPAARLDQVGAG